MKPLTEWTDAEVREHLWVGGWEGDLCLAELLRRERERCAAECDTLATDLSERERRGDEPDGDWSMKIRGYETAARVIRRLGQTADKPCVPPADAVG